MLTQQQIQLPGVVLHVAHVVQNQLEDAEVSAEILESGLGFFVGQTENGGSGFFTTMLEVGLYFGFAVNAIWVNGAGGANPVGDSESPKSNQNNV
jgi:hypothetical protein